MCGSALGTHIASGFPLRSPRPVMDGTGWNSLATGAEGDPPAKQARFHSGASARVMLPQNKPGSFQILLSNCVRE